ncbi:MAG: hypothetical protein AAF921_27780 [Cyanobacteria bacterium P01_D01_bin.44]
MNNQYPYDNLPDKNLRINGFDSNEAALSDTYRELEGFDLPNISNLPETFALPETYRSKHIPTRQETKMLATNLCHLFLFLLVGGVTLGFIVDQVSNRIQQLTNELPLYLVGKVRP